MRFKVPVVVVGVATLAVVGWWCAWREPAPAAEESVARVDAGTLSPARVEPPLSAPSDGAPREPWAAAVDAVVDRCDLGLERACEGPVCVAVLEVPALDGPVGWARMAWRSPSLVAAVVAGDLGLPDRVLPCRDAIRDLPGGIRARAAGQGEVWCLVEPPGATGASTLCDALSLETYGLDPGFATGTDRIVELRPPGA